MLSEQQKELFHDITETLKDEIRKREDEFLPTLLASLATSLVQSVVFSAVKFVSGRWVRREGTR